MIRSGVLSEINRSCRELKITDPYSPTARRERHAKAGRSAGNMWEKSTRVKVCSREAPSVASAFFCRVSDSTSSSTPLQQCRTTKADR